MVVRKVVWFALLVTLSACQTAAPPAQAPAPAPQACSCPAPEPVQCPEPPAPEPCPPPPVCPKAENVVHVASPARPIHTGDKLLVGEVEFVDIEPGKLHLEARIDSGAKTSSLHAVDIVRFERDGQRWVRFKTLTGRNGKMVTLELPWERHVRIKGEGEDFERRPVVEVDLRLGSRTQRIQVTLADRTNYDYPVLVGRNFLRDNVLIDVSRDHLQGKK